MSQQRQAIQDLDLLTELLGNALDAVREARVAVVTEDPVKLEEAIIKLDDLDGITLSSDALNDYLQELSEFDAAGAAADDAFDHKRDGQAIEAETR